MLVTGVLSIISKKFSAENLSSGDTFRQLRYLNLRVTYKSDIYVLVFKNCETSYFFLLDYMSY